MKRRRLCCLRVGLALLLLISGNAMALTNPIEATLRWLLGEARQLAPGQLSYEGLTASWGEPLLLTGVVYRDEGVELRIERVTAAVAATDLLARQVTLSQLIISGVELRLTPTPDAEPAEALDLPALLQQIAALLRAPPTIELPVTLLLEEVRLQDAVVQTAPDAEPLQVQELALSLRTQATSEGAAKLLLEQMRLRSSLADATLQGALTPSGRYPVELTGEGELRLPAATLQSQLALRGDLAELNLELQVRGDAVVDAQLAVNDLQRGQPRLAGQVAVTVPAANPWPLTPELLAQLNPDGLSLQAELTAQGDLTAVEGALQLDLATRLAAAGEVVLRLAASATEQRWRLQRLTATASAAASELTLQGEGSFEATPRYALTGEWQSLGWPLQESQVMSRSGQLTLEGRGLAFEGRLSSDTRVAQVGEIAAELAARGTPQQVTVDLEVTSPQQPLRVSGTVEADIRDRANPELAAALSWQQLRYPLDPEQPPQVSLPSGELSLNGTLEAFRAEVTARLEGEGIPPGDWRLSAQGSPTGIDPLTLEGDLLAGSVSGEFAVAWQPTLTWQGTLRGSDISPASQFAGVAPGALNFALATRGEVADSPAVQLEISELSGRYAGQPVAGGGRIDYRGETLTVDEFNLQLGASRLSANGRKDEQWQLDLAASVPNIGQWLPAASGAVELTASAEGEVTTPVIELDLAVADLRLPGAAPVGGDELALRGRVDLSGETESDLRGRLRGVTAGGQRLATANLRLQGTPQSHRLTLDADAAEIGQLALALQGELSDPLAALIERGAGRWQGTLQTLRVEETPGGSWQMARATPLQVVVAQGALAQAGSERPLCLRSSLANEEAEICLQGRWRAADGVMGSFSIADLNPQTLLDAAEIPAVAAANLQLETEINGQGEFVQPSAGAATASATVTLAAGEMSGEVNGQALTIPLNQSALRLRVEDNLARGELALDLGDFGRIEGQLQRFSLADQALEAELDLAVSQLDFIPLFVPALVAVDGRVNGDLTITGQATAPVITGEVALQGFQADVPAANLQLRQGRVAIAGQGDGALQVAGSIRSDGGEVNLDGTVELNETRAQLTLAGDDFQAIDTAELKAIIAPDLNIDLSPSRYEITGQVEVTRARLSPPQLNPSGVSPSSDVVIIEENAVGEEVVTNGASALPLYVDVRIVMGDVMVSAAGFEGELGGAIAIEQTPQLPPRGRGQLEIEAGEYEVYGQRLNIERGQLLFSGQSLTNPGVNLRVEREVDEVTAGVLVTGTVSNLELELTSTPALPDTAIMSYLVFGRAPDARSDSENALLLQAASGLASGAGGLVGGNIARVVGLDELSFNAGSGLEQSSVTIGKYLTPDLYVGYSVGLFDSLNTLNLRYRINKFLSLEADSNAENTSGEVSFSVER